MSGSRVVGILAMVVVMVFAMVGCAGLQPYLTRPRGDIGCVWPLGTLRKLTFSDRAPGQDFAKIIEQEV